MVFARMTDHVPCAFAAQGTAPAGFPVDPLRRLHVAGGARRVRAVPCPGVADGAPVTFSHVGFSYRTRRVLTDVDFSVHPGGFSVLIGGNGAGKSTIVKLALGQLTPDRGQVLLFGQEAVRFRDWARIGYVPQRVPGDYDRFPATVYEMVRGGLYARTKLFMPYGRQCRAQVTEALETVELGDLAHRRMGELSGGQLQRAFLARAIVNDPGLLLLDEPTSNLDEESTTRFYHAVAEARASRGVAVLLVTHDLARLPCPDDACVLELGEGCVKAVHV